MKTVIFDMDGVLVDSEPFHCQAWIKTYQEIGIMINQEYYFSRICGQHGMVSTTMVLNDFNKEANNEDLIRRKEEIVSEQAVGMQAIPGAVDFISVLRENNYTIGLASSTSHQAVKSILNSIGISNTFSVIHSGESVKQGKPDPDIYLKTARMLSVDPTECVVIEDTNSGVLAAKKAGMKVIGLLNGRNTREQLQYADMIADGFADITPEKMELL